MKVKFLTTGTCWYFSKKNYPTYTHMWARTDRRQDGQGETYRAPPISRRGPNYLSSQIYPKYLTNVFTSNSACFHLVFLCLHKSICAEFGDHHLNYSLKIYEYQENKNMFS